MKVLCEEINGIVFYPYDCFPFKLLQAVPIDVDQEQGWLRCLGE